MTQPTDLKLLERDAFRKFYEDGLMDVFLGLMLVTMSAGALLADWLDSEAAGLLGMLAIAVVLVTVFKVARHRLLRSRLGQFRPGPERRRKISATRLVLLGSVLVGVVAFGMAAMAYAGGIPLASIGVLLPLLWFANAVVVMGAMAYYLDVPRFALYGVLFGIAMPLLIWPDVLWGISVPVWVAYGIPGAVIVVIGLFTLRRFLRRYPPLPSGGELVHGGR